MTITAQTPAEFEEILLDDTQLKNLWADGEFGTFVKKYVNAIQTKDKDFGEQVKEQVETVLADMVQMNRKDAKKLNLSPDSPQPAQSKARPNPRAGVSNCNYRPEVWSIRPYYRRHPVAHGQS